MPNAALNNLHTTWERVLCDLAPDEQRARVLHGACTPAVRPLPGESGSAVRKLPAWRRQE